MTDFHSLVKASSKAPTSSLDAGFKSEIREEGERFIRFVYMQRFLRNSGGPSYQVTLSDPKVTCNTIYLEAACKSLRPSTSYLLALIVLQPEVLLSGQLP